VWPDTAIFQAMSDTTEQPDWHAQPVTPASQPEYVITSRLSSTFRDQLEDLVYFHPSQHRVHRGILSAIRDYGKPSIVPGPDDSIQVLLGNDRTVQTLFAIGQGPNEGELLGITVFTRTDEKHFLMIHLAVKEEYAMLAMRARSSIALSLVDELKRILRQVKGAEFLRLLYANEVYMDLPLR
jgi:hypothetical protein